MNSARPDPRAPGRDIQPAKPLSGAPPQADPGPKKKILLVDDNRVIVKTLSTKIRTSGYEVLTAEDGAGAISAARQQKPDLMLLDVNFPPDVPHGGGVAWDGFLIMDWLRRLEEAKRIPVIIITGSDPASYKDRALAAGAVNFLPKPVKPEELLAAIRQALGEAPASPAP